MEHNLSIVREKTPNSKIWAIVKANAYGHGLERAMGGFSGADGLALVEISDAVYFRAGFCIKRNAAGGLRFRQYQSLLKRLAELRRLLGGQGVSRSPSNRGFEWSGDAAATKAAISFYDNPA